MRRFEHSEAAIDMIFSTSSRALPHCPRCMSRRVQDLLSGEGWRLWKCHRCAWEANIPVQYGRGYAREIVHMERSLAEVLRPGLRERKKERRVGQPPCGPFRKAKALYRPAVRGSLDLTRRESGRPSANGTIGRPRARDGGLPSMHGRWSR